MVASWIWQQPDWPWFRWDQARLQPLLHKARHAREHLMEQLDALEAPLAQKAMAALLGLESLGTAAIEGEQLDPGQVRSSLARRLGIPLAEGHPAPLAPPPVCRRTRWPACHPHR